MQHNESAWEHDRETAESANWDGRAYREGYSARHSDSCELESAPREWRDGWRELLESSRQRCLNEAGAVASFKKMGSDLYHAGNMACIQGFPFDGARTQPWKLG